jgi:transposase-like protein
MHETTKLKVVQPSFEAVKRRYSEIREVVHTQMRGAALKLVMGLFAQEIEELCGPRFARKGEKYSHRGGSDPGSVLLEGQRVAVTKPRVRKEGRDVELATYGALQGLDLLSDRIQQHMLVGVSTRNYDSLLEEIAGGLGLSRSSVSRAFVRGSRKALDAINGRDLSKESWIAVLIDSVSFGERVVTVAMGITRLGGKVILGLKEGDTENWEVCKDLLQSLVERGFPVTTKILFVLDGSKALKKAVRKIFGDQVPIQRCVRHKERNVLKYLPESHHAEFRRRWKAIHAMVQYVDAKRDYDRLVTWLGSINQAALESLLEADEETLTVIRLNTPAKLRKTLLSTNPIESSFDGVRTRSNRVKRWRAETDQVSRWAAATLLDVEKRFRRIRGYREIPLFLIELHNFDLLQERKAA